MDKFSLRSAEKEDVKDLFRWRNDPLTRKHSFTTRPVPWKRHLKWFHQALNNPKRTILIAYDKGHHKIGQIRFDRSGKQAEISIIVASQHRGKGYALEILTLGCKTYIQNNPVSTLTAKIKHENAASLRIFLKAGFQIQKKDASYVTLCLKRQQVFRKPARKSGKARDKL